MTEKTSDGIDKHMAEILANDRKEDEWKVIMIDNITSRPINCTVLAPVECNP